MLNLNKSARLLAALACTGALALPSLAQDKMAPKMGGKMMGDKMMDHKMMGGKMAGGKMAMPSDKMVCQMCKMSAAESKTYMGMSKAEKMLFMKHMDKMMGDKMMGGKMMDHKMGKM